MKFVNRILAALLALALIAGGMLLVVEVIAERVGSSPVLARWDIAYSWGQQTTWDAGVIRIVCIVMAIVGLVLLIAELKRPAVKRLKVAHAADNVDIAYTRRGVASAVKGAATGVDGVRSASASVGRRSVKVNATASATEGSAAKSLTQPVTSAVQKQVNDLKLDPSPRVQVTMRARRS